MTNGEWKLQRRGFPSLPKQTYKVEKKKKIQEREKQERYRIEKRRKKERVRVKVCERYSMCVCVKERERERWIELRLLTFPDWERVWERASEVNSFSFSIF